MTSGSLDNARPEPLPARRYRSMRVRLRRAGGVYPGRGLRLFRVYAAYSTVESFVRFDARSPESMTKEVAHGPAADGTPRAR